MRIGIGRPSSEHLEGRLRVFFEKRPNAELASKTPRELVLRLHRYLEVVEPIGSDEDHVGEVEERCHAHTRELVGHMLRAERAKQDVDSVGVGAR
jgi:hypothetical protein